MARQRKIIIDIGSALVILALIVLSAAVGERIFLDVRTRASGSGGNGGGSGSAGASHIYFFSVTQGASSLLVLPGGITVLTDAGSDNAIVNELQTVMPPNVGQYIDLAIISSPQSADYGGYQYLLAHYTIGAFLYNGRSDAVHKTEWQQLMTAIVTKHIPLITIAAGDRIRYGTDAAIDILSPDGDFAHSADPSDTGIVQRVATPAFTVLLAADMGANVENALIARGNGTNATDLRANILKAPFPGVGTAAGDVFLRAVAPKTVVVMPGVKGTASVPTKAMLAHLASSTNAAIVSPKGGSFLLYNK